MRPPCGNQMVTVKRQRDGRIENRRLMDEVKKLQKTTLLRSDEAAEPLESNQCLWLARRWAKSVFALLYAGFDLGLLSNRYQPSSLHKNTFNGWCSNGARDKGLAKVCTLNCNFKYNSHQFSRLKATDWLQKARSVHKRTGSMQPAMKFGLNQTNTSKHHLPGLIAESIAELHSTIFPPLLQHWM